MNHDTTPEASGPSRRSLLLRLLYLHLALGALLRVVLWLWWKPGDVDFLGLGASLGLGAVRDLCIAPFLLAPVALCLGLAPVRWLARRAVWLGLTTVVCFAVLFDVVAQACFFEEFTARYNHVAVDYVLYPHEVLVNLHESYPIPAILLLCSLAAFGLALLLVRPVPTASALNLRRRAAWSGAWLSACVVGVLLLVALPARSFADRVADETAHNGHEQLWRAWLTAELDYAAYYATLPAQEAHARAQSYVGLQPELSPHASSFTLAKAITPHVKPARPLDVVVVVEESLGSDFSRAYGGSKADTPRLDGWSQRGLMLSNLVANGNRTVRGLEGVLCSFVPLPGDSITKRPATKDVATLAAIYQRCGYDTSFVYGGRGMFDTLEPFASANGWAEFVEQADMPEDAFYTAWGAADEWAFDVLVERQLRARANGRPLFATLLTVSNHKPYLVPERDTGVAAKGANRDSAVAYADWSLGRWLDRCQKEGLLEHTVVLVVGDHGARVYGAESIPVGSYRIPAFFVSPEPSLQGKRIDRLCSQVDLAPTLLSMTGIEARVSFFGEDLLRLPPDGPGRAFVIHNRNVGLLTDEWMVVLGLQKEVAWWRRDTRASNVLQQVPTAQVPSDVRELERDAMAIFQTADELYRARGLTVHTAKSVATASN